MGHTRLTLFIISALLSIAKCDLEATLKRCCNLGSNWAKEGMKCSTFPAPVNGVSAEQQSICLSTVEVCCLRTYRCEKVEAPPETPTVCDDETTTLKKKKKKKKRRRSVSKKTGDEEGDKDDSDALAKKKTKLVIPADAVELIDHHCEAGKEAAHSGSDCLIGNSTGGEYQKDCCEACKLGLISGSMGTGCSLQSFAFGAPWDTAYQSCCMAFQPSTTPLAFTTPSAHRKPLVIPTPALDSLCDLLPGELCAHICVPIPGSYRCECHHGFSLMADGKSCQSDGTSAETDRCTMNNPCEHICTDTGIAIECHCHPGYKLAADERSCVDIDECTLGISGCSSEQTCKNEVGGHACVNLDGTVSKPFIMDKGPNKPGTHFVDRCPVGFHFNFQSQVCDDVDECQLNIGNCPGNSACQNTIGSYVCVRKPVESCPPGYQFSEMQQSCIDIDECSEGFDNCQKETQFCINTEGAFTCQNFVEKTSCPAGYKFNKTFATCEDVDECEENIHGCLPAIEECRNTIGAYECDIMCESGYKYSLALRICVDIDECAENKHNCTEGAECINSPGSYTCRIKNLTCATGTEYDALSKACTDINECVRNKSVCSPHEECVNTWGSFVCKKVSQHIQTTTATLVENNEARADASESNQICPAGFYYSPPHGRCFDVNECTEQIHVCNLETEECINEPGGYRCKQKESAPVAPTETVCQKGFMQDPVYKTCIDINECDEKIDPPCDSNQICINTMGSFLCNCKRGFQLDPLLNACVDINECQVNQHNCLPSQRCDNTIGSFHCIRFTSCGTGYTLNAQTGQCEDDDECALGTDDCRTLGPMWQCRNTLGSFRCERKRCEPHQVLFSNGECRSVECPPGYETSLQGQCIDINECEQNSSCRRNQRCINIPGSFRCINLLNCALGFELNEVGNQCIDIDECARGSHECGPNQLCINRPGDYACQCPPGHTLNGAKECVDIDECTRFAGQICSINSQCVNTFGSYRCVCKEGFKQNPKGGNGCVDIDECVLSPGLCQQTCINIWGSYRCSCNPGFVLHQDNRTCQDIDECEQFKDRNLCVGFCVNQPGSYGCSCPEGYRLGTDGRTCQDIDECLRGNVCRHSNEICLNTRGGYRCNAIVCPPNFVKDTEHKNRCKRASLACREGDTECLRLPLSYSFNFITFVSNLAIPLIGYLDLFTMRGPAWASTTVRFNFTMLHARAPTGIPAASKEFFQLRRAALNQATISLSKTIIGPQDIDLQLAMEMYHNGIFSGLVVARLSIFVSQYEF